MQVAQTDLDQSYPRSVKHFPCDASACREAPAPTVCSLCCWHLAVNNAISHDKMLRRWLFNLSGHRAGRAATTQAWTTSAPMWFLFYWLKLRDWTFFFFFLLLFLTAVPPPPHSASCLPLLNSRSQLVWFILLPLWCWLDWSGVKRGLFDWKLSKVSVNFSGRKNIWVCFFIHLKMNAE